MTQQSNQPQQKATPKTKYVLEDKKGKKLWEGNMRELIEKTK